MANLDSLIDSMREDMINTLQKWIRQPSIKADPAPQAPFGTDIRSMLDIAEADCRRLGFDTQIFDGYAMHADLGEGDEDGAFGQGAKGKFGFLHGFSSFSEKRKRKYQVRGRT